MINKLNIEKFYDYFDFVANTLYNSYSTNYLEGMNEAFNLLLDDAFSEEYSSEDVELCHKAKSKITAINFDKEEIRKSVQLGLLKGYKHAYMSNALITPDTIGIFISYLIEKLYKNKELKNILDPMIGSGNLVFTILNQIKKSIKVYGVDNDILICNIARNIADLLEYENEIFYQETLTYFDQGFDLIVTDLPISDEKEYFPYKAINHHLDSLASGKYFISLIENDFFEKTGNEVFKEVIAEKAYIYGLIRLSETLFKQNPKSILIIKKKENIEDSPKNFLLVDLPSFNDTKEFNKALNKMNIWFMNNVEE